MTATTRRAARALTPARVRERARLRVDRATRLVALRADLAAERRAAEPREPVEAIRSAYRDWRARQLAHRFAIRAVSLTFGIPCARIKTIVSDIRREELAARANPTFTESI